MNVRVPAAVAVALWGASALAVLGYTLKAYKATAGGVSPPHPLTKAQQGVVDLAQNAPALVDMNTLAQQANIPGPAVNPTAVPFGGAR